MKNKNNQDFNALQRDIAIALKTEKEQDTEQSTDMFANGMILSIAENNTELLILLNTMATDSVYLSRVLFRHKVYSTIV